VLTTSTLYAAGRALGTDLTLTDPGKAEAHQLILPEIAVFTLVFALLGWGALALLERFTRRAAAVWTALAVAVLLVSFVPIGLEQATSGTRVLLVVIHTAVAAVLVPSFRRR
jgi:heme A synthase